MTVLNLQIADGANDGRETGAGVVELTSATGVIMPASSVNYWAALRFLNVTIPEKATLSAATLSLYFYDTSNDSPDVDIYADDADNSAALVETDTNLSGRTKTTAKTTWTATNQNTGWITSPDLTAVIQEVVDRDGWASGNALTLLLDARTVSNSIRFRSYENDTSLAAKLDITYTDGGTQTITIAASADDAHEATGGAVSTTAQSMDVDGVGDLMGMRFPAVNVPPGATITTAYINVYTNDAGRDSPNVTIKGQVNAAAFTTGSNDLSSRTMTTASVQWVATDIGTGAYKASPSLVTVIQEIVNDGGWVRGNALAVFLIQNGASGWLRVAALDHTTDPPPQLVVEWSLTAAPISGAADITLGAVTTTAAGVLPVAGSADVALGAVTTTAAGKLAVAGAAAVTLGAVTVTAAGRLRRAEVGAAGTAIETTWNGAIVSLNDALFFVEEERVGGVEFRNLVVPPNVRVAEARLEMWLNDIGAPAMSIQAEADPFPAVLNENDHDLTGRSPLTTASVPWEGILTGSQYEQSPDLAAIFNELVALDGWTAGSSDVVLILTDTGGSYFPADGLAGSHPPRLILEWEPFGTAAVTLSPVTVTATGALPGHGAADLTLGALTTTAAGQLLGTGAADVTLDALTAGGAATLLTHGDAAITLGAVTVEAAAVLPAHGAAELTLDALTIEATGAGVLGATADITLGAVTVTATAVLPGHGEADITLGDVTTDAAGEHAAAEGTGQMIATLGAVTVVATAVLPGHGAASVTLDDVTAEGAGVSPRFGEASVTLDALTSSSAAKLITHGAADITLGELTATGEGLLPLGGLADIALDGLILAATGVLPGHGQAAITLDAVTATATAGLLIQAAAELTLDALTAEGAAVLVTHGTLTKTLGTVTVTATGALPGHGAAALTLDALTTDAAGALAIVGQAAITLEPLTATGEAVSVPIVIGEAAITLDALTATGAGVSIIAAQASITLGAVTTTATAALVIVGQGAVTLGELTAAGAGVLPIRGQGAATLEPVQAGGAGVLATHGAAVITLDGVTVTAHAGQVVYGAAEITLGGVTVTATALLFLASIYIGVVRSPAGRGAVVYPRPVGSVRTAGDIE